MGDDKKRGGGGGGGAAAKQPQQQQQRRGPLDIVEDSNPVLYLDDKPLRFEPINSSTDIGHVIFDEVNGNIFVVKNKGRRIRVLSDKHKAFSISLDRESEIKSLRFSLDSKILGIRRSSRALSFVNLDTGRGNEFQQTCKSRSTAQLRDFYWTGSEEVCFVTSHGLELYQVLPKRQQTKLLKSVAISVSFSMYCSESKLVVIASSLSNTVIQPYFVNDGVIARVPKFQVDLPGGSVDKPPKLTNTEVSVAVLYGQPYIFVIRNYPKTHVGHKADVTLYLVTREGCQKSHVLVLRENGRFMLNIVDNLVVVHSQPSRASYVFDIRSNAPSQSQRHTHAGRAGVFKQARSAFQTHFPIVSSTRIQPATIGVAPWQTHRLRDSSRTTIPVELYSRNWVAFHPNIIIDPSLGVLWRLRVLPSSLRHHMKEFDALVDVLVRRTNGHDVIIQVLREALDPRQRVNIAAAGRVFDIVNRACMKAQPAQPNTTHLVQYQNVSQLDVYVHLLSAIRETESMDNRTFVAVLLEYIRSLHEHDISVEHNVYDLLFAALVEDGRFYQLHQFLQYHVIDDDKYLACRLLSIKDQYQPALQLAMDMFKRLGDSQEEIFHVLLTQQQIVTAMHYLRELGPAVNIRTPGSRLLKAVQAMGDPSLFLSAFEFFQERRRKHPNDFGVGDFEGMAKQFAALQQQPSRSPSKPRPP